MFELILPLAAVVSVTSAEPDLTHLAIDRVVVKAADIRVPVSESVRAATWDDLSVKPSEARNVRLACIVFVPNGAPGACVPADGCAGKDTIDWAKAQDEYARARAAGSPIDADVHDAAQRRIQQLRLVEGRSGRAMFVVKLFDELVAPSDRRPVFGMTTESLKIGDVILREPIDGALIQALYPVSAMREGVGARMEMRCTIQPALTLLCRDPGQIITSANGFGRNAAALTDAFKLATYQVASSIRLAGKSKSGEDVVGKNLQIAVNWRLPDN